MHPQRVRLFEHAQEQFYIIFIQRNPFSLLNKTLSQAYILSVEIE